MYAPLNTIPERHTPSNEPGSMCGTGSRLWALGGFLRRIICPEASVIESVHWWFYRSDSIEILDLWRELTMNGAYR